MVPHDIVPDTEAERVLDRCLACSPGLLLNAFVIGSMASALSTMDSKKASSRPGKLKTIEAYLQISGVAPELRGNILEFYEYLYTSTLQSMEDLRLYQDLPPSLATRLALTVHRRVVSRAPFLTILSDDALLMCLSKLRALVYVPSQVVLIEGQPLKAICFVIERYCHFASRLLGPPDEKEVRRVCQYDNFGLSFKVVGNGGTRAADAEVASQLLEAQFATEWARAETYCDVVSLSAQDLRRDLHQGEAMEQGWPRCSEGSTRRASLRRHC